MVPKVPLKVTKKDPRSDQKDPKMIPHKTRYRPPFDLSPRAAQRKKNSESLRKKHTQKHKGNTQDLKLLSGI